MEHQRSVIELLLQVRAADLGHTLSGASACLFLMGFSLTLPTPLAQALSIDLLDKPDADREAFFRRNWLKYSGEVIGSESWISFFFAIGSVPMHAGENGVMGADGC